MILKDPAEQCGGSGTFGAPTIDAVLLFGAAVVVLRAVAGGAAVVSVTLVIAFVVAVGILTFDQLECSYDYFCHGNDDLVFVAATADASDVEV